MKKGDKMRVHIGQDRHGHGGFVAMGEVIAENDHVLVITPTAFLLIKNEVGTIEELPRDSLVENALRTVQVGRESYLGKTREYIVKSVEMVPLDP